MKEQTRIRAEKKEAKKAKWRQAREERRAMSPSKSPDSKRSKNKKHRPRTPTPEPSSSESGSGSSGEEAAGMYFDHLEGRLITYSSSDGNTPMPTAAGTVTVPNGPSVQFRSLSMGPVICNVRKPGFTGNIYSENKIPEGVFSWDLLQQWSMDPHQEVNTTIVQLDSNVLRDVLQQPEHSSHMPPSRAASRAGTANANTNANDPVATHQPGLRTGVNYAVTHYSTEYAMTETGLGRPGIFSPGKSPVGSPSQSMFGSPLSATGPKFSGISADAMGGPGPHSLVKPIDCNTNNVSRRFLTDDDMSAFNDSVVTPLPVAPAPGGAPGLAFGTSAIRSPPPGSASGQRPATGGTGPSPNPNNVRTSVAAEVNTINVVVNKDRTSINSTIEALEAEQGVDASITHNTMHLDQVKHPKTALEIRKDVIGDRLGEGAVLFDKSTIVETSSELRTLHTEDGKVKPELAAIYTYDGRLKIDYKGVKLAIALSKDELTSVINANKSAAELKQDEREARRLRKEEAAYGSDVEESSVLTDKDGRLLTNTLSNQALGSPVALGSSPTALGSPSGKKKSECDLSVKPVSSSLTNITH